MADRHETEKLTTAPAYEKPYTIQHPRVSGGRVQTREERDKQTERH